MFAAAVDMEPGMFFRTCPADPPLEWLGVEPVVPKRKTARRWVRVLVGRGGVSFIADATTRFQVVEFGERK